MKQLGLYGSQVDAKKVHETAAKTCGIYMEQTWVDPEKRCLNH